MSVLRPLGQRPVRVEEPPARSHGPLPLTAEERREPPTLINVSRLRGPDETDLVKRLHGSLTATMGAMLETATPAAVQTMLNERFPAAIQEMRPNLGRVDRARLQDAVRHEIVGFGPIQDPIGVAKCHQCREGLILVPS